MKRFKDVMKNEEGLTLVELLAVVVILAIIAGIGALGIGQIIQNAREDAQVSSIQMAMSAAQLYDTQQGHEAFPGTNHEVNADELTTQGLIKTVTFEKGDAIKFKKDTSTAVISLSIGAGAVKAGPKVGTDYTALTDDQINSGKKGSKAAAIDETNITELGRDNIF